MASNSSGKKLSKGIQLLIASHKGNLRQLKDLVEEIENGKDETYVPFDEIRDKGGVGLFHAAASGGRTNVCKYFLEELNFDVNQKDDNGYTPLIHASFRGQSRTIEFLIHKGADPTVTITKTNATALHYIAARWNADVIPVLVANGADVNAPSKDGTPLTLASQKNRRNAFKSLLDNGADPNLKDGIYGTLLGSTLSKNSTEFTELMLKAGADPNAISCTKTPLGFAAAQGKLPFIKLLLKYKADPNIADKVELLPIEHAAIRSNRIEVSALLPVTQPILACSDWSVKGIINYVNSQEAIHKRSSIIKKNNSIARAKGDYAFNGKAYYEANQHYTEAIAYDPCDATAHAQKSYCSGYLGSGDGCMESAKVCMTLRPDWPEAYLILGIAYRVRKDFDKAAEVFLSGLRIDPQNNKLHAAFKLTIQEKMEGVHV